MLLITIGDKLVRSSVFRIDSYPTVKTILRTENRLDKEIRIQGQERRIQKLKDEGKII